MKVPVIENDDFIIYLENYEDTVFIHCDVLTKYTKTIRKKLLENLELLVSLRKSQVFAIHEPEDHKHRKFLQSMRFDYLKSVTAINGQELDIYIHRGTQ